MGEALLLVSSLFTLNWSESRKINQCFLDYGESFRIDSRTDWIAIEAQHGLLRPSWKLFFFGTWIWYLKKKKKFFINIDYKFFSPFVVKSFFFRLERFLLNQQLTTSWKRFSSNVNSESNDVRISQLNLYDLRQSTVLAPLESNNAAGRYQLLTIKVTATTDCKLN